MNNLFDFLPEVLQTVYFENTLFDYITFFASFLVITFGFFLFKRFLLKKVRKYAGRGGVTSLFVDLLDKVRFSFYAYVSFYFAHFILVTPYFITRALTVVFITWLIYRVLIATHQIVDYIIYKYLERSGDDSRVMAVGVIGKIVKALLWMVAIIIFLSALGINVTGLVAGMGIGGVAIAFALQNILSDLFSSFSIYFDRPFVEGDFIAVGDKMGVVEKIGIKSTRIRALQGEEIIFSNKELTTAQIHNLRKMVHRRNQIKLGVIYETPTELLRKIPTIIQKIIEKEELAEFDRAHFSEFNDFSLDFIVIYFTKSRDYKVFMDLQERILLEIKKEFEKEKIEFAYPTKSVYLFKKDKE